MDVVSQPKLHMATLAVMVCLPSPLRADAIVMTRAMQASTIAEIFVEPGTVRVELEIGSADLSAFSGVLPRVVRAQLLPGEEFSSQQQPEEFFREVLVMRVDQGEPIVGEVQQLAVRRRTVRDEITGEPVADQPADAERIVFARLIYPLPAPQPKSGIRGHLTKFSGHWVCHLSQWVADQ